MLGPRTMPMAISAMIVGWWNRRKKKWLTVASAKRIVSCWNSTCVSATATPGNRRLLIMAQRRSQHEPPLTQYFRRPRPNIVIYGGGFAGPKGNRNGGPTETGKHCTRRNPREGTEESREFLRDLVRMEIPGGPRHRLLSVRSAERPRRGHRGTAARQLAAGLDQLHLRELGRRVHREGQEGGREDHLAQSGRHGTRMVRRVRGPHGHPDGPLAAESKRAADVVNATSPTRLGSAVGWSGAAETLRPPARLHPHGEAGQGGTPRTALASAVRGLHQQGNRATVHG